MQRGGEGVPQRAEGDGVVDREHRLALLHGLGRHPERGHERGRLDVAPVVDDPAAHQVLGVGAQGVGEHVGRGAPVVEAEGGHVGLADDVLVRGLAAHQLVPAAAVAAVHLAHDAQAAPLGPRPRGHAQLPGDALGPAWGARTEFADLSTGQGVPHALGDPRQHRGHDQVTLGPTATGPVEHGGDERVVVGGRGERVHPLGSHASAPT